MATASLQGRTCSVSARPCRPTLPYPQPQPQRTYITSPFPHHWRMRGGRSLPLSTLIPATAQSLTIPNQDSTQMMVITGTALDATRWIQPQLQTLILYTPKAQHAFRQLFADH